MVLLLWCCCYGPVVMVLLLWSLVLLIAGEGVMCTANKVDGLTMPATCLSPVS